MQVGRYSSGVRGLVGGEGGRLRGWRPVNGFGHCQSGLWEYVSGKDKERDVVRPGCLKGRFWKSVRPRA